MKGNPTDKETHIASVIQKALGYSTISHGTEVDLLIKTDDNDGFGKSIYIDDDGGPITVYVSKPYKSENFSWFKETLKKIADALRNAGIPCEEKSIKTKDHYVYTFEITEEQPAVQTDK